jgi:hypothetical protein
MARASRPNPPGNLVPPPKRKYVRSKEGLARVKAILPGIRVIGTSEAIISAKVPRALAELLREAARANARTVSGEVRWMLAQRFAAHQREEQEAPCR